MLNNFYKNVLKQLMEIKPTLLLALQHREMEVKNRGEAIYQVHWKKREEQELIDILIELESILEEYELFQNSMGKEIIEYLSLSKNRKIKSILNLYKKDVWFEKDVHSRYKLENNKLYRFFKDDCQSEVFLDNVENIEDAKQAMINQCRKEIVDSFVTKFKYVEKYLKKEIDKLEKKMSAIKKSSDKPSKFYTFGSNIIKDNPTIAIIILGVAIECQLKLSYGHFIRENKSLGEIIAELKKRKRMKESFGLLDEINNNYVKAKHEKDTLIQQSKVETIYQQATIFFNEK
ncbi:MAG: hypothetical protein ACTSP3_00270 [Candidatus Heimdallarchaeaceae archaeon]